MAGMSFYLSEKIAKHIFQGTSFTMPATIAIALFTGDPGNDYTGPEVPNSNNYARVSVPPTITNWGWKSATEKIIWNENPVVFPIPTGGGWNTVTHFGVLDSLTWGAGKLLFKGPLIYSRLVVAGDTFAIGPHMILINVDKD